MAKVPLENLYKELDESIKAEQFKKSIELCDKILGADENEKEALHCKIIAYIHLSQFDKAVELLEKNPDELQFERAYCYYKLSSFEKARDLLEKLPPSSRLDQLSAQLNYRLGKYDTSIQTYDKILQSEDTNEIKVNLLANFASCSKPLNKEFFSQDNLSFEYYYNLACCLIYRGDLSKASELLDLAEKRCEEVLRGQAFSEEEILDELAIIKVQKGYLLQLKGSPHISLALYNDVLHSKVSDVSVTAIASNNLVSVKKDQKLFSAEKKLQNASNPAVDLKLTSQQRNIILFNRAICLLKMNKMEQCKEFVHQIEGNDEAKTIIQSAILVKEKKVEEAIELLEKAQTLELKLSYAQWLFQVTKYEECLAVLQSLKEEDLHRPALVSFRTFLYLHLKNVDKANATFDQSIDFWKKNNRVDLLLKLLKPACEFKMKYKFFESAAQLYKLLIEYDKNNAQGYVPLLVICLSHFNPIAAEEYAENIPSVKYDQIDAEELENSSLNFRVPKAVHDEISVVPVDEKLVDRKKNKKKKKKKKRTPKNFNPMVIPDPERWLPRKDRSNFKRRKTTKKSARGAHQGADISLTPVKVEENKPAVVVSQKQNKKAKKGRRR